MKEKLSPHIEKINSKLFIIKSAFLIVDQRPLLEYLISFKKRIDKLTDTKPRILLIENSFIENLSLVELEITRIFIKNQYAPLPPIAEDYFDYIIILGERNPGFFTPESIYQYVKNQSAPIFISIDNSELIELFKKNV